MTSRRVFELANKIHELLSSHGESKYLFSRKQVILVGDFSFALLQTSSFEDSPLLINLLKIRFRFSSFNQVDSSSI